MSELISQWVGQSFSKNCKMFASRKWFQNNKTPSESRYLRDLVTNFPNLLKFLKNLHWARRYRSSKLAVFRKFPDLAQDLSRIWSKVSGILTKTGAWKSCCKVDLVRFWVTKRSEITSKHHWEPKEEKRNFRNFSIFSLKFHCKPWLDQFWLANQTISPIENEKKSVQHFSRRWNKVSKNCAKPGPNI